MQPIMAATPPREDRELPFLGHASYHPHNREIPFSELSPIIQKKLLKPKVIVKKKRTARQIAKKLKKWRENL